MKTVKKIFEEVKLDDICLINGCKFVVSFVSENVFHLKNEDNPKFARLSVWHYEDDSFIENIDWIVKPRLISRQVWVSDLYIENLNYRQSKIVYNHYETDHFKHKVTITVQVYNEE